MIRSSFLIFVVALLAPALVSPAQAAQQNTIIYGKDYDAFATGGGGWQACERACERDRRCEAWLFIRRGQLCRLKSDVGPTRSSKCCVSDVKRYAPPPRPNNVTGIVTTLELAAASENLGACVQTAPAIPRRFDHWACLRNDSRLYAEMSDLLMSAYRYGDECQISWRPGQARRGQPAEITSIRCTPANR